jgi:hypothetical protein
MTENAVVVHENKPTVGAITQGAGFYSSLKTETRAEKMAYLKAITNSKNLKDELKGRPELVLQIVDVVLQEVEIADENGNVSDNIRITLIDAEGVAYHATSKGIAQSLKTAFGVFGTPDVWTEPLEVTVLEEKGRGGFYYLTLKFV